MPSCSLHLNSEMQQTQEWLVGLSIVLGSVLRNIVVSEFVMPAPVSFLVPSSAFLLLFVQRHVKQAKESRSLVCVMPRAARFLLLLLHRWLFVGGATEGPESFQDKVIHNSSP